MSKPYVVAIAGGTCSGKSTLTDRLEAILAPKYKLEALRMDGYFKKEPPMTIAPITRKEYVEHNSPDTLELERMYEDFARMTGEGSEELVELIRRMARRIVRFMSWGQTFEEVTERYLDTVRFRHNELIEPTRWHADLVVNGTLDRGQGVEIVRSFIEKNL